MRTPSHSTESCLQSYHRVSDLVQQGLADEAREAALAIPVDHLRWRALLLVNYSRELRRPAALRP